MAVKQPYAHAVAVRLSALGDVVLTTGPLLHWHQTLGTTFTVVTRQPLARIFEGHPAVTDVMALSVDDLKSWPSTANRLARSHGGSPLVDLHGSTRSMLLAALWTGPYHKYPKLTLARRVFRRFRPAWAERKLLAANVPQRYAMALDDTPPPASDVRPRIFLAERELDQAREFLISRGLDPAKPIIALHPYATHPAKFWPREHWLELVRQLRASGRQAIAIGAHPKPFLADVLGQADLTNTADIRGSAAILGACSALVTGDSGPMHLATAVDTPVVALFGPTTEHWGFFPSGERDVVLQQNMDCRPCSLHGGTGCHRNIECLRVVTPRKLLEALTGALEA